MKKNQEFFFRCVGFQEIFDLLDLDRFDEILLEDMHRSRENIETGIIEIFQRKNIKESPKKIDETQIKKIKIFDHNGTKSIGTMKVEEAKTKFL